MTDHRITFLRMLLSLSVVMAMTADNRAADPPAKDVKEPEDSAPNDELSKKAAGTHPESVAEI